MIAAQETEELFLDYKRSADNGSGIRLHDADKRNLSKAISGLWELRRRRDCLGSGLPK